MSPSSHNSTASSAKATARLTQAALSGARDALALEPLARLRQIAGTLHGRLGFVGGTVRDWMTGAQAPDVDFLWTGDLAALAQALEDAGLAPRYRPHYRTLSYRHRGIELDVAAPRHDHYTVPGGVPEIVAADIDTDLKRRDFTSNALILWIDTGDSPGAEATVLHLDDRLGGCTDIAAGLLRPILPGTLSEDPLRVVRGARYLARFGWSQVGAWDQGLALAAHPTTWDGVAPGRMWFEAQKIADEPDPAAVWAQLGDWGVATALADTAPNATTLAIWRHWRSKLNPERAGTGRNWLIDLAVWETQQPGTVATIAARWRPPASELNRWRKLAQFLGTTSPLTAVDLGWHNKAAWACSQQD